LHVRRKENQIAVMFFVEDRHFWTHITRNEFKIVFGFLPQAQQDVAPKV